MKYKVKQHKKIENWEKEFDKEFDHYNPDRKGGIEHENIPYWCSSDYYLIKDFIRKTIRQAKEERTKEIMEIIKKLK